MVAAHAFMITRTSLENTSILTRGAHVNMNAAHIITIGRKAWWGLDGSSVSNQGGRRATWHFATTVRPRLVRVVYCLRLHNTKQPTDMAALSAKKALASQASKSKSYRRCHRWEAFAHGATA